MKEITRIVIKGRSGYVPMDHVYSDKVIITPGSIEYEYIPAVETPENPARKWKYTSNTPEFREQFDIVAAQLPDWLLNNLPDDDYYTDMGEVTFEITFKNIKKKFKTTEPLVSEWFEGIFMDIKMMVPFTEKIPATLWTRQDEEDEE